MPGWLPVEVGEVEQKRGEVAVRREEEEEWLHPVLAAEAVRIAGAADFVAVGMPLATAWLLPGTCSRGRAT